MSLCSDGFCQGLFEVLLSADESGGARNVCAWDPRTGEQVRTFKGSSTARGTLGIIADSFIVSACPDRPILNVWKVSRREQVEGGQACPLTHPHQVVLFLGMPF